MHSAVDQHKQWRTAERPGSLYRGAHNPHRTGMPSVRSVILRHGTPRPQPWSHADACPSWHAFIVKTGSLDELHDGMEINPILMMRLKQQKEAALKKSKAKATAQGQRVRMRYLN